MVDTVGSESNNPARDEGVVEVRSGRLHIQVNATGGDIGFCGVCQSRCSVCVCRCVPR